MYVRMMERTNIRTSERTNLRTDESINKLVIFTWKDKETKENKENKNRNLGKGMDEIG